MFKIHLVFLRRRWNNAFEPEPFNHIIILNISVRLFTITFGILFNIIGNTRDSNDLVLFQLENTEIWPILKVLQIQNRAEPHFTLYTEFFRKHRATW